MSYTDGYSKDDQILPYPWQTVLPTDDDAECFRAINEWIGLIKQSKFSAGGLMKAWLELQRAVAVRIALTVVN